MAKVFIGIALIVMLATAALGFLAKSNIDKLQSALTTTKGKIAAAEGAARAAKADAEKAQAEAKAANEKLETATQIATAKTKEAEEATNKAKEATIVIETKDKEIATLNDKIAEVMKANVDPAKLAEAVAAKDAAVSARDAALKEVEAAKLALESQIAKGSENEKKVADLQKEKHDRELNIQKRGLQGRVLAVNSGWNFVVLSVGDRQGVLMNSTLLVVRGNEPIARLRITSVEPSTSIADVMPGTARRGTVIQPGDTVIFEGNRNVVPTPGTKAPEATIPPITPPASSPLPNS